MAIDSGTSLTIAWQAYDARTLGLNAAARVPVTSTSYELDFAAGSGALQFTQAYSQARTLSGASEDVDLNGALADCFGATIAAVEVKAWGIKNASTHTLTIGATGGSNWTTCLNGTITLPPGAVMAFGATDATGWTVTAGTGDLLHVAGTSGDVYELILWVD